MRKIFLFTFSIVAINATASMTDWLPVPIKINSSEHAKYFGAWSPRLCSNGDKIFVAWEEYRNGVLGIFFDYSTDGGLSWQDSDIRIHTPHKEQIDSSWYFFGRREYS